MKFIKYCFCCLLMVLSVNCSVFANVDYYMRVVLVGDYSSGKTAIWKRLKGAEYDENEQRSDFMQSDSFVENVNGNNVKFKVWDTAGADKYYDEVVEFTKGANLVVIVHDTSKPFNGSSSSYLQKIYKDIHSKVQPDGKIVLVGSKYDKRHDAIVDTSNQVNLLKSVAKTIPCARIITSAKENEGIQNLKNFIIRSSKDMQLYRQDPDNGIGVKAFEIKSGGFCTIL